MDLKDRFNLLYASLVDTFKGYVENVMKTLASIILTMGWILTSDTSRKFLAERKTAYVMVLGAIIIVASLHTCVSIAYYFRSQGKIDLLSKVKEGDQQYVEPSYYSSYKITPSMIVANLMMNLSLFAVLFMMIYTLR
ncbi:MAG: hypothetical protein QOH70_2345 [Blastocatellia bacterium]|jgi:hypothetical protein|nr:hypothetical protein [Blastocatellia bacterium]